MKKIIFVLMLVLLSSFVSGALSDDLIHVYTFDDDLVNATIYDEVGNNNLVATVSTNCNGTIMGISGNGYNNPASDCDWVSDSNLGASVLGSNSRTFSLWVKFNGLGIIYSIWDYGTGATDTQLNLWYYNTPNTVTLATSGWSANFETPTIASWENWVIGYDGSKFIVYVDGVNKWNETRAINTGTSQLYLGNNIAQSLSSLNGAFDEFYIWDRLLSATEVLELNSTFYPFVVSPVINSVNLTDQNNDIINGDLNQFTFFNIIANVTVGGVQDDSLVCNWTTGVIASLHNSEGGNYTIDNSTSFEFSFEGELDFVTGEVLFGRFCRVAGIKRNINIYVNDNVTPYISIDKNIIPLCSVGVHEEVNISSLTPSEFTNISVRCDDCGVLDSYLVVESDVQIGSNFEVIRRHTQKTEDMIFNSTTNLYKDVGHRHGFSPGSREVNVTCNGTTESKTFISGDLVPTAIIEEINGVAFVNNTIIESGNVSILGECSGELISSFWMAVKFSNNTVVKNDSVEFLEIESDLLSIDDNYTIMFHCVDDEGNTTTIDNHIFQLLDTTNPSINVILPNEDIIINNTAQVQVQCTDTNLFGINVSIDCSVQGNVFSYLQVNFTGSSIFLDNVTDSLTTLQTCTGSVECCDDHTSTEFEIRTVNTDRDKRNISIDEKLILSDASVYDVTDLTFTQERDRVSYCFTYETFEDKFIEKRYKYRIPKTDGWVTRQTDYQGHFASWETKQWQDLEPQESYDLRIDRIEEFNDYYLVHALSDDETVCFESIGGLNCVTENFNFSVVNPPSPSDDLTLQDITIGQAILLLVFVLIYIAFLVLGILGNGLFLLLAFLLSIVLGLIFLSFNVWFGVVFLVVNIIMALILVVDGW